MHLTLKTRQEPTIDVQELYIGLLKRNCTAKLLTSNPTKSNFKDHILVCITEFDGIKYTVKLHKQ